MDMATEQVLDVCYWHLTDVDLDAEHVCCRINKRLCDNQEKPFINRPTRIKR